MVCISTNHESEKQTIYVCEMPKTYFLFSDSTYPKGKLLKIIGGNPKTGMIKIGQEGGIEENNYEVIEAPTELKRKFFNGKTQVLLLAK